MKKSFILFSSVLYFIEIFISCSYTDGSGILAIENLNTNLSNGSFVGTPIDGKIQGTIVNETWMNTDGSLVIDGKEVSKTNEIIAVPKGTIVKINMKSADSTVEVFSNTRKVKLSPFVMGKYPVTRGLYKAVMGEAYYEQLGIQAEVNGKEEENPVTRVNFFDAIVFCNKLSIEYGLTPVYSYNFSTDDTAKKVDPEEWFSDWGNHLGSVVPTSYIGRSYKNWLNNLHIDLTANGYRLPTEAEWEFCARGGDPDADDWEYRYSGSNVITEVVWYYDNARGCKTNAVGEMNKANRLGLYDMNGNVWEWCNDFWSLDVTENDRQYLDSEGYIANPLVVSVSTTKRIRGGSCFTDAKSCSISSRGSSAPYYRLRHYGFRVCRTIN